MENPIKHLHSLGQSIWYDNIQRGKLENGLIAGLIRRDEIRGMTSNPSIFNQAIAGSTDYDAALQAMAWAGWDAGRILDQLIVEDIQTACDLFLPLFQATIGGDGYVSVEVSPHLAHDTVRTLTEAQRLWKRVNRPNVMIKIPGTPQGLPAVRQAITAGINVNVTLIFSLERYQEVMAAYLSGLEQRLAQGLAIDHIASVASFFISRIDSKVDQQLEDIISSGGEKAVIAGSLCGKLAVASGKLAYEQFSKTFGGERFTRLRAHGGRVQRPLWASTSTKNPKYPDTKYVAELIGPDTVNTIPSQTLEAYRNHGRAQATLTAGVDDCRKAFDSLAGLGISIERVTQELEAEGVQAFADAFTALQKTVENRRQGAVSELGPLAGGVSRRVAAMLDAQVLKRMHANDPALWTDDPAGQEEIRRRVGWLELPESSRSQLAEIASFVEEVKEAGYTHVLLLGMGGSSLAPEVMRQLFGVVVGGLDLAILDSTDPAQVRAAARHSAVKRTLYIVASKSGGTAEINAFLDYFWERARHKVDQRAGEHFIAITDAGTSLEKLGCERGFRRIFLADPKVGGRFSALTLFGLLPAGLIGVQVNRLLARAAWMARQCTPDTPAARSPGLVLGAILGEAALQGRDKLTLISGKSLAPFGAWLEQLVAESSGKNGLGIVPVDGEKRMPPGSYGKDRLFVYLRNQQDSGTSFIDRHAARLRKAGHPLITIPFEDQIDLGSEFFRWEVATAIACAVLRVNAFDQPDVLDSKTRTVGKITAYRQTGGLDEGQSWWEGEGVRIYGQVVPGEWRDVADVVRAFLAQGQEGDYVAINAYLPRSARSHSMLQRLRIGILESTGLATTLGFGPRFLHSTGQLHKGGKNNGLFLQITAEPVKDLDIPNQGLSFGVLQRAQALGDFEALVGRGRRVLRLHFLEPARLANVVATYQVATKRGK